MPTKILFAAANPLNSPFLRLDQEFRNIQNCLRESQYQKNLVLLPLFFVRKKDLRKALLHEKPNIVHLCGHGSENVGIAFESDNGYPEWVDTDALAEFFALFKDTLECVVLNGCYSEIQAEAIAHHIKHVIGISSAILDTTAIKFAAEFYEAIGEGHSVASAFAFSVNALRWANVPDYEFIKLHGQPAEPESVSTADVEALEKWLFDEIKDKHEALADVSVQLAMIRNRIDELLDQHPENVAEMTPVKNAVEALIQEVEDKKGRYHSALETMMMTSSMRYNAPTAVRILLRRHQQRQQSRP